MKNCKFLVLIFLISFLLPAVSAGRMSLSSSGNSIILNINENSIPIAAGRIYMKISEPLALYEPAGTGFFSAIYRIQGNNSNLELQFFDFSAGNSLGQLSIPFTAPAGVYSAKVERIELYNKSDFLIPFNYPVETRIAIGGSSQEPSGAGGAIGSAGGGAVFLPSLTQPGENISQIPQTQQKREQKKVEARGIIEQIPEKIVSAVKPYLLILVLPVFLSILLIILYRALFRKLEELYP